MEKLDQGVKEITVVVSNLGVHIIHENKGFYHNFMSKNGVRINCSTNYLQKKTICHIKINYK